MATFSAIYCNTVPSTFKVSNLPSPHPYSTQQFFCVTDDHPPPPLTLNPPNFLHTSHHPTNSPPYSQIIVTTAVIPV